MPSVTESSTILTVNEGGAYIVTLSSANYDSSEVAIKGFIYLPGDAARIEIGAIPNGELEDVDIDIPISLAGIAPGIWVMVFEADPESGTPTTLIPNLISGVGGGGERGLDGLTETALYIQPTTVKV